MQVVPGCDMAGIVVKKGEDVSKFEIGDEVYGNIQDFNAPVKLKQLGTLAEYVAVEENLVASKPANLSFEEAASLPLAIQTAVEGFKTGGFEKGQNIFIVGGAGGVGTQVVQLAKHLYGASEVVATTSTPKVDFVKSLGADRVIDYTKTKYEDIDFKCDFLYDTIGKKKLSLIFSLSWLNFHFACAQHQSTLLFKIPKLIGYVSVKLILILELDIFFLLVRRIILPT